MKINIEERYVDFSQQTIEAVKLIYEAICERTNFQKEYLISLDLLAMNIQMYNEARKYLLKSGFIYTTSGGFPKAHPAYSVMSQQFANIRKTLADMGLTPQAESRIRSYGDKEKGVSELIQDLLK